jgi:hypothetical protein
LNPEKPRLSACPLPVLPGAHENPFQNTVFGPAVYPDIDGIPGAKGLREGLSFTTFFADIDEGVQKPTAVNFYIPPLFGEKTDNFVPLLPCYFHILSNHVFIV